MASTESNSQIIEGSGYADVQIFNNDKSLENSSTEENFYFNEAFKP